MVAKLDTGPSIRRVLFYNQNKVDQGVATCIGAENYPKDHDQLTADQKLNRLLNQAALNQNVRRNAIHASLNFHPSEQLSDRKMMEIAKAYMELTGLSDLPYLVYRHFDAGHPHLHLVSVKVRADGSRVETQNIGRNQSEFARKKIEETFGLIKAQDSHQRQEFAPEKVNPAAVHYGKTATKKAISAVLQHAFSSYKFTSLHEFNALLKLYNIGASRGSEDSRTYKKGGLTYSVLNEHGAPVGVPIKASDFYFSPTLKALELAFVKNEPARARHKNRLKNTIDLQRKSLPEGSLPELITRLEKQGISTLLRKGEGGFIYGITYIDHRTKCVFNGSALGKAYSAKAMQQLHPTGPAQREKTPPLEHQVTSAAQSQAKVTIIPYHAESPAPLRQNTAPLHLSPSELFIDVFETLASPEYTSDYVPYPFRQRKKKKKKKRI